MGKIEDLEVFNGEGYQLSRLDKVIAAARANSVWPLPFATMSFCAYFWYVYYACVDCIRLCRRLFVPNACGLTALFLITCVVELLPEQVQPIRAANLRGAEIYRMLGVIS